MSGAPITAHPKIGTISFTGGTVTGRKVAEDLRAACSRRFRSNWAARIRTSFSPTPISTPPSPAACALLSRTRARFVCAVRASSSSDRPTSDFVDRFVDAASKLKVGDPLEETTDQGAIVRKTQLDKVKFYVDLAQKEGGKIALGGSAPESINERCRRRLFLPADGHHRFAGLPAA